MNSTLTYEENLVFSLRSIYAKYGYSQYKMRKFEEYDLYVKNKDFLISNSIITFTDTNGKLMALKPDVTLSIVKNAKDVKGYVEKLYYNENVYRVSSGSKSFKEIMQVGLECIGDIDDYSLSEVITLAAKSLKAISEKCVLSISHLGLLYAVLNLADIDLELKNKIIKCIEEKNGHELKKLALENEIGAETVDFINDIISLCGKVEEVLPKLKGLSNNAEYLAAYEQFETALSLIDDDVKDIIQIDFSVVSDAKYYNGIVFKGFIEKIPNSVLSGGQYDSLMQKMQKKSRAIGFAVYIDMLDPLKTDAPVYEKDVVVLYDEETSAASLKKIVEEFRAKGNKVSAQRFIPEKESFSTLVKVKKGEVESVENNA